jgi:hypothetical protein
VIVVENKLLIVAVAVAAIFVGWFGFKIIKRLVKVILLIVLLIIIAAVIYFRLI